MQVPSALSMENSNRVQSEESMKTRLLVRFLGSSDCLGVPTNSSAVGFRTHQIEELPISRNTKCGEHQHAHQLSESNSLNRHHDAMPIPDISCPSSEEIVSVRIIDIHALVKHHGNEPYLQLV